MKSKKRNKVEEIVELAYEEEMNQNEVCENEAISGEVIVSWSFVNEGDDAK